MKETHYSACSLITGLIVTDTPSSPW